MVFDNAFTPVPLCGPARASLLTGKRPIHHGILFNKESGCAAGRDFFEPQTGYAGLLADRGYRCTHVGKWHIGTKIGPADYGLEGVFYPGYGNPAFGSGKLHPHYRAYIEKLDMTGLDLRDALYGAGNSRQPGALLAAIHDGGERASLPYYLAEQTIAAIREAASANQPFFVSCNFWGPHAPYVLPESYMNMYDLADVDLPDTAAEDLADRPKLHRDYVDYWGVRDLTREQWTRLVAACYGYVSLIDAQIGRILATLTDLGVEQDTAVLFTSDHGGMVGSHGLVDKGPFLYDPVCRIPQIIRLPGRQSAGQRSDAIVYNMDLMPTLLEIAGAEAPPDLDAKSILPLCQGAPDAFAERRAAFVEYHGHQIPAFGRMVRTDRFKYVFNGSGLDEFYDVHADPEERTNRVNDTTYRDQLTELRETLADYLIEQKDPVLRFYLKTRLD
jgi:arylsulfatase A-like enzyme